MIKDKLPEKPVLFWCEEELRKELHIIAARDGDTLKEILTKIVKSYVEAHKDGNEQHLMTNFLENEDFVGFPSMAVDLKVKKEYCIDVLSKDPTLKEKMYWHLQEWVNLVKSD